MKRVLPTKGNLLKLKDDLKLAKNGYALLEKKRNVLMREMLNLIGKARELQDKLIEVFEKAYRSLQMANLDLGMEYMDEISRAIPEYTKLGVRMRSVMGVEVPEVKMEDFEPEFIYSIYRSNSALDKTYLLFTEALKLIAQTAWVENAAYRLAYEIKKTRKRVNALENIVIPNLKAQIKFIQDSLEEMEREDYVRIKKIKEKISK